MPTYKNVEPIIEELKTEIKNLKIYGFIAADDVAAVKLAVAIINDAPVIDPIHAAGACYCKECKHCFVYRPDATSPVRCSCLAQLGRAVPEDGFCYRGEKITFPAEESEKTEEEKST